MSYNKAIQLLPNDLIKQIQEYIDGEYIYIPRKNENKKHWGEGTSIKDELNKRNLKIYRDYLSGVNIISLAGKYYLSSKSIQRILLKEKKKYK